MRITKNDHIINVADDQWVHWWKDSVYNGYWEWETFTLMDAFLTKDMDYIDIGAWIGPTALYAVKLAKHVYALEPDPVAYHSLLTNASLNSFMNLTMFNEAIMDYEGQVTIGGELGSSMTRIGDTSNAVTVPCRTLAGFVEDNKISKQPLFIKMDCEGAEEFILKDVSFFETWKPILYLSTHPGWFQNHQSGVDIIRQIGGMYAHHTDSYLKHTDLNNITGAYVFYD